MNTISSIVLALCATFALLSAVSAKAVAEPEAKAEAKSEAEAGILGLNDVTDYRFANGLPANALVNPYTDLRRGFNVFRGGVGAARSVVPLDSAFALRGLAPIYNPSAELTGYGGYGAQASLAAQAKLRGITAARAALINQAIANQYYDNLLRSW